jgi:hypothetical protein
MVRYLIDSIRFPEDVMISENIRWQAAVLCFHAGVLAWAGCGSRYDVSSVEGYVRLDGEPLPYATLRFEPRQGRQSVGVTDPTGHFVLRYTPDQQGAQPGEHRVMITTKVDAIPGESGSAPVAGRPEMLPPRYHEKSELTAEVKTGRNTIDFELTSDAK